MGNSLPAPSCPIRLLQKADIWEDHSLFFPKATNEGDNEWDIVFLDLFFITSKIITKKQNKNKRNKIIVTSEISEKYNKDF